MGAYLINKSNKFEGIGTIDLGFNSRFDYNCQGGTVPSNLVKIHKIYYLCNNQSYPIQEKDIYRNHEVMTIFFNPKLIFGSDAVKRNFYLIMEYEYLHSRYEEGKIYHFRQYFEYRDMEILSKVIWKRLDNKKYIFNHVIKYYSFHKNGRSYPIEWVHVEDVYIEFQDGKKVPIKYWYYIYTKSWLKVCIDKELFTKNCKFKLVITYTTEADSNLQKIEDLLYFKGMEEND